MKKLMIVVLTLAMAMTLGACGKESAPAEEVSAGPVVVSGVAEGFGGDIEVEVTLDGDKITDVTVVSHSESDGISDGAIEEIPAAIVEANSTKVDIVSGATYSSNGIMAAVENALDSVK